MNIENVPKSLRHLVPGYLAKDDKPTEGKFKKYVRDLAAIKRRRNPSRSIVDFSDMEAISYLY